MQANSLIETSRWFRYSKLILILVTLITTLITSSCTLEAESENLGASTPQQIVAAQETVLTTIYQNALASVVHIQVTRRGSPSIAQMPLDTQLRLGSGSGFVWDEQGHIVTNYHVVSEARDISIQFADGTDVIAEVIGGDPDSDLAVLRVSIPKDRLYPLPLGTSDSLRVGQLAVAIGNPFGQEFTMNSGIVSGLGRSIKGGTSPYTIPKVIQTDAPINPGDSGGPLLDRTGRVIGINTQIISRSGASSGIGLSIPIDLVKRIVPSLISDGLYIYPWLGISGVSIRGQLAEALDLPRETRGTLIIETIPGGPAELAGLLGTSGIKRVQGIDYPVGGDLIAGINGVPVNQIEDLIVYLIEETTPGDSVSLLITRGNELLDVEVVLQPRQRVDQ
jgi:S1-C subfamily serine protease